MKKLILVAFGGALLTTCLSANAKDVSSSHCLPYFQSAKSGALKSDLESQKLTYPDKSCLALMVTTVQSFLPPTDLFEGEISQDLTLREIEEQDALANKVSDDFIGVALRFLPLDQALIQILEFEKNLSSTDEKLLARKQQLHQIVIFHLYLYVGTTPSGNRFLSPTISELIQRFKYPKIQKAMEYLTELSYFKS